MSIVDNNTLTWAILFVVKWKCYYLSAPVAVAELLLYLHNNIKFCMHHKNVCLYIGNSSIKSDNNNKIEAE